MADRYYTAQIGNGSLAGNVTESTTTTPAAPFEFRWTYTASGMNRQEVVNALEGIKSRIIQGNMPPV